MTDAITVGQLAKQVGLSRSTLLYYDRLGLLHPGNRSRGDYRLYDRDDLRRLRRICLYRNMGLPLKEIAQLLGREGDEGSPSADILERHLGFLESQIESLQHQQRQVIKLLEQLPALSPGKSTPDARREQAVNLHKELPARSSARASGQANVRRPRARPSSLLKKGTGSESHRATPDNDASPQGACPPSSTGCKRTPPCPAKGERDDYEATLGRDHAGRGPG